ncbi:PAS domain S-box protein [Cystobacter fuscus]|uniref:ATP-binding protein n=1 Tax=Cystobacter fuscus TaxID=43 RepID=UPI002B291042|nr:PAS domain S-box protein [Cystobacter fuscus]
MRSLSFRSLFLLLMVTPVVVATGLLGWLSYRAAREVVAQDAIREVGIAANAREQSLKFRLSRQRERAQGFLNLTRVRCAPMPERERPRCFRDALADFAFTETALGARFQLSHGEPLRVGTAPEDPEPLVRLPPGQWVRFEPGQGFERVYELIVHSGDDLLGIRFGLGPINGIFQDRDGLGSTGESFLVDAEGAFLTMPKHPGHGEQSHPLDSRPLRACLEGRDGEMAGVDYRGVQVIHAFRYVEEMGGGCIMVHIEQAEAFAPAYRLRLRVAQASAALVSLTVGLSFLFARRLSRPVHNLTRTARALQAGDFDVAVPAEGPGELKTFATTFERMARSLQASTDERNQLLVRETEARQEAESQKALLRLIIEQSGEGLIMADTNGIVRLFNAAAERHHGATAAQASAPYDARPYKLFTMDGRALTRDEAPLQRAVRGEVVTNARWRVLRPDGQWRTLEGTASPLRQPDGTPVGGVLIAHDVTQQQQAEADRERLVRELKVERTRLVALAGLSRALAESRLSLESILDTTCRQLAEHVGDVCCWRMVSADGRLLEARVLHAREPELEASARKFLMQVPLRTQDEAPARALASDEPLLVSPEAPGLRDMFLAVPPKGGLELERWRPSGVALLPLRAPGRTLGLMVLYRFAPNPAYSEDDLVLFREVVDRTALAIENARLFQQEQQAVRIRDDLVAVVSHDLRNPISAISMSASVMLKREGLTDWQAKGLSRIYSAADRALRMIRDLLDSTQARVGGIPVSPRPLDLHGLARHVVEEVQLAHPERHILFQALGDAHGAWDADRMAQVITNLVGNAVQHSSADSTVRVETRGLEEEVQLSVRNEGTPIPAEELPTLFEPFRRGRGAGGVPGSVGLGLFITRQIVEAHGGVIEVRSQEGEGTVFRAHFPRDRMPAPSAA